MLLADVHAHLDKTFFKENITDVINRAKNAGVKAIIANGVDHHTNLEVLELAKKHDIIKPALGIYPPDALEKETSKQRDWDIDKEIEFISSSDIVAIGEIGLDFKNGTDKALQVKVFEKLLETAKKNDLPVIIHSRKAEAEVINILEMHGQKKVVMHCFSGNHKLVERIRKNRWCFSIPANIVRSEHFQKIVKETELKQLLTETDSPFLSPFREKTNEPAFVIEAVKKIAEIKGLEIEETANILFMNYQRLFA